jgi:hypothetical protein
VTDEAGTDHDQVRVRRAPKFPAFLFLGGVLGAIVALILTSSRQVDPEVGFLQMLLFLGLFCVVGGMLLGAIVALIFERVFSRGGAVVDAERTHVVPSPIEEPPADEAPDAAETPDAAQEPDVAQTPDATQAPDSEPGR